MMPQKTTGAAILGEVFAGCRRKGSGTTQASGLFINVRPEQCLEGKVGHQLRRHVGNEVFATMPGALILHEIGERRQRVGAVR
jgi:hypothetical protein